MHFFPLLAVAATISGALAAPSPVDVALEPPTRVINAKRAVVTPPPCKAISPPPTEAETEARFDKFGDAFIVKKNLTEAFEYISSTYIVGPPPVPSSSPQQQRG